VSKVVVVDSDELHQMISDAVTAAMGASSASMRPVSPKQLAEHMGVGVERVREWIEDGMPCVRTSDVRGIRVWLDRAREWLEANRA